MTDRVFAKGLREYGLLGMMLGGCHGIAETTHLGWYGADLAMGDVLILLGLYALLGALGGAILWGAVLLAFGAVGRAGRLLHDEVRRRSFVCPALLAYAGMGCWLIAGSGGGWNAGVGAALVVLAAGGVALRSSRRVDDSIGLAAGLLGACFVTFGATIFSGGAAPMAAERQALLAAGLALPGVAALSWMLAPGRRAGSKGAPGRLRPAIAVLGIAALVDLGLWMAVWPAPFRWRSREAQAVPTARAGQGPNVLLIVLDAVRADHLDLFGYDRPTMPHLRAFGRNDCIVAAAITATAPFSLGSHGSIFTGMYPSSHGAHKPFADDPDPPPYGYFLRDDVTTLAEGLGEMGYRTVGISANHAVLGAFGLDRGFSEYDARPARWHLPEGLSWTASFRIRQKGLSGALRRFLPRSLAGRTKWLNYALPHYRRGSEIRELATRWLDGRPGEPFFMFLNFMDAHSPYLPVGELDGHFVPRPPGLVWSGHPHQLEGALASASDEERREILTFMIGQYDGELVYLDGECHRLYRSLQEMGLYEETMIIVVSDHGESFLEHGTLTHGWNLYQPQLMVPLLIKLPRSFSGDVPSSAAQMQFVDIFPTIMAVLGGETPPTVEGSPWGTGRDYRISERFASDPSQKDGKRDLFAVTIGDWKYIRSTPGGEECYDLRRDPEERENILGERPGLEQRAREIMARRKAATWIPPEREALTRPAIERLRAIGYMK